MPFSLEFDITNTDARIPAQEQGCHPGGAGYVVDSLEATLWCFAQAENFRDCILMAANLGDDADTTAAQAGQLAGAFYGESGIPAEWLGKLTMMTSIRNMADALATQTTQQTVTP